ncbi:MAG: pilus assembly protein PilM [Candidatus Omnitrophota bacterium]
MSEFGIYFGTEVINITEFKGKREAPLFLSISKARVANLVTEKKSEKDSEKKTDEDSKAAIATSMLANILKEELSKNNISPHSINVALAGEELIIRTFDLPIFMSKKELEYPAIAFEAKKYIPFKIEDLVFDFRLLPDKKNKRILVLFVGIKTETLSKYFSLFEELQIRVKLIEYAGFSLLRLLKSSGLKDKGTLGFLNIDLKEETNFVVCQNGFPLFSRDIVLLSKSEGESKLDLLMNKMKSEIRISLDYFRRKFPTESLKNLIVLSPPKLQEQINILAKDLDLSAIPLETSNFLDKNIEFSTALVKSYATAISHKQRLRYSINLLRPAIQKEGIKGLPIPALSSILKIVKINSKVALIAVLIIIFTIGWGLRRILPLENALRITKINQPKIEGISDKKTLSALKKLNKERLKKIEVMKDVLENRFYLTEAVDIIPYLMPQGTWLVSLTFEAKDEGLEFGLEGAVMLDDSDEEFAAVNDLVLALRNDPKFNQHFREINIVSMEKGALSKKTEAEVTRFVILCR